MRALLMDDIGKSGTEWNANEIACFQLNGAPLCDESTAALDLALDLVCASVTAVDFPCGAGLSGDAEPDESGLVEPLCLCGVGAGSENVDGA